MIRAVETHETNLRLSERISQRGVISTHSDSIKHKMMSKAVEGYYRMNSHTCGPLPGGCDYCVDTFSEMGTRESASDLFNSLFRFLRKQIIDNDSPQAYFAVFDETEVESEEHFNTLVWSQLYQVHQNVIKVGSDDDLQFDPTEPDFMLNIGGKVVNITGLHPHSSQQSRRFPWAVLVFSVSG